MTVKISVSADVSDVQSELKKVQDSVDKINKSFSVDSPNFDFKQGKDDLAELAANAKKLADILDKAKKSGTDFAGVDFDSVSKVFEDAASSAEELDKVLEYLGQSDGMAKVVKSSKELTENIKKATKEQKTLREENKKYITDQEKYDKARKSGTAGTRAFRDIELNDLMGGGWRSLDTNENKAKTKTRNLFEFAGMEVPHQFSTPDSETRSRTNSSRIAAIAGAVGGYAGGMGQGGGMMGTVGQLAGSGIGAAVGAAAGSLIPIPFVGSAIGAGVGAFAGKALGAAGSSVDAKTEAVAAEGAMYTDLRHSLGSTSIDFEMLRGSVRHFSEGLGLAYNESAKLAKEFAHTANLNGKNGMEVGKEVGSAVAFGRGYGIAPEQSVQFMASMRQMGVTQDDKGNRKLAMQIAESVKSGGTTAKMDEVLASIQSYTQSATRQSLTAADAGGYAAFMSTLTGLSMPGMRGDPHNAANAMGAADTALRQGGGFGEASKNFSLALWQRNLPGFTGLDQDFMNEQGAFGSIEKAFDKNSPAYKFAEARGDNAKMSQYDDWAAKGKGKNVLEMQMGMLEDESSGDTDEFRKNIQSHLGVGAGQASALYQAYKSDKGIGGLEKTLSDAKVDMGKMSMDKISSLAALATGSEKDLKAQALRLKALKTKDGKDELSTDESKTLDDENPDKLRSAVLKLSSEHDALGDSGDKGRELQATINNLYQELATKLVPYTQAMKDGIVELVRKAAPDSDYVKRQDKLSILDAQVEERKKMVDDPSRASHHEGDVALYNQSVEKRNAADPSDPGDHESIDAPKTDGNKKAYNEYGVGKTKAARNASQEDSRSKILAEAEKQGLSSKETAAVLSLANHESTFNADAVGPVIKKGSNKGDRAHGLFQYMANSSIGWDRDNVDENIAHGVSDFKKNAKKYGIEGAISAHQAGEGVLNENGSLKYDPSDGNQKTSAYTKEIMAGSATLEATEAVKGSEAIKKPAAEKKVATEAKPETTEDKKKLVKEVVVPNQAAAEKKVATEAKPDTSDDPGINAFMQAENKPAEGSSFENTRWSDDGSGIVGAGYSYGSDDYDGKADKDTIMNAQGQIVTHKIEGSFTLNDQNGASKASPVLVTSAGSPVATGT